MEAWDHNLSAQTKVILVLCFKKAIYNEVGFLTGADWQCMPAERRGYSAVCTCVSSLCIIGTFRAAYQ